VTSGTKSESGLGETIRVISHALLIALVIRTFLFQPVNIPSGSMKATLLVGDYLFVSKYSYGYSHYSIPLSPPLFSGRIFGSEPERGDIVVFRLPKDDSTDYIKRVIGLPGETILIHDDKVWLKEPGGEKELERGEPYGPTDADNIGGSGQGFVIPRGYYLVMGDNRNNSKDSRLRFGGTLGLVPEGQIKGGVRIRLKPLSRMTWFSRGVEQVAKKKD